jgi:hypothetical protein
LGLDRLDEVLIEPRRPAAGDVFVAAKAGECDEESVLRARVASQSLRDLKAVLAGQPDIEQDYVWTKLLRSGQRAAAIERRTHGVTSELEQCGL